MVDRVKVEDLSPEIETQAGSPDFASIIFDIVGGILDLLRQVQNLGYSELPFDPDNPLAGGQALKLTGEDDIDIDIEDIDAPLQGRLEIGNIGFYEDGDGNFRPQYLRLDSTGRLKLSADFPDIDIGSINIRDGPEGIEIAPLWMGRYAELVWDEEEEEWVWEYEDYWDRDPGDRIGISIDEEGRFHAGIFGMDEEGIRHMIQLDTQGRILSNIRKLTEEDILGEIMQVANLGWEYDEEEEEWGEGRRLAITEDGKLLIDAIGDIDLIQRPIRSEYLSEEDDSWQEFEVDDVSEVFEPDEGVIKTTFMQSFAFKVESNVDGDGIPVENDNKGCEIHHQMALHNDEWQTIGVSTIPAEPGGALMETFTQPFRKYRFIVTDIFDEEGDPESTINLKVTRMGRN